MTARCSPLADTTGSRSQRCTTDSSRIADGRRDGGGPQGRFGLYVTSPGSARRYEGAVSGVRLSSYRLTEDTGFAPNPFFGVLTLATDMPELRRSAAVDDWIAGFTSNRLCGDACGNERLVYLMRVEENPTIADYFGDHRFSRKIPTIGSGPEVERHGDNIYQPRRHTAAAPEHFDQLSNPHHWDVVHGRPDERSKRRDVGGRRVLVAREFVYFGREALRVAHFARPVLPRNPSRCCSLTPDIDLARAFIDFALGKAVRAVMAAPHGWPSGDDSWRQ